MCGASQSFHQFIHEVFCGLTFVFLYCDDILGHPRIKRNIVNTYEQYLSDSKNIT